MLSFFCLAPSSSPFFFFYFLISGPTSGLLQETVVAADGRPFAWAVVEAQWRSLERLVEHRRIDDPASLALAAHIMIMLWPIVAGLFPTLSVFMMRRNLIPVKMLGSLVDPKKSVRQPLTASFQNLEDLRDMLRDLFFFFGSFLRLRKRKNMGNGTAHFRPFTWTTSTV